MRRPSPFRPRRDRSKASRHVALRRDPRSSVSSGRAFALTLAVITFLLPQPALAQGLEQGEAQISFRAFQETDTSGLRDNVGGSRVELHQLLHNRGVLNFAADANRGKGSLFGRNYVQWLGLPWRNRRVSFTVGDLFTPLDRGPLRFSNLYVPYVYAAGAEVNVNSERWAVSLFGGRNQQPLGPRIQFLQTLPDTFLGAQAAWQWKPKIRLQSRYLHTRARAPAQIVGLPELLLQSRAPRRSDSAYFDLYYNVRPSVTLLGQLGFTNFTPQPEVASLVPNRNFLSYTFGPYIARKRFQLQANLVRQGITYLPLSNVLAGDRQGEFVTFAYQALPRVRLSGSAADFRNNPERNPRLQTFEGKNLEFGVGFLPGPSWSLNVTGSRSHLESRVGSQVSPRTDSLSNYRVETYKNYGHNQSSFRWQRFAQETHFPTFMFTRFHSFSFDQRRSFRQGDSLFAGVTVQKAGFPGSHSNSLNARAGGNIRLFGFLSLYGQAEFGHDFANETLFATNNLRTTLAGFNLRLPRGYSLRGDLIVNSLRSTPNPESVFFAGAVAGVPVLPVIGLTHRLYFLELRKDLRWGRSRGLPLTASPETLESMIPTYGLVEGFAFDDRNRNGARDAGEEGLPYVEVSLAGRTTVTGADGHFQLPEVRTGHYVLKVEIDHLPAFYSPPPQLETPIQVRQRGNPLIWIPLEVLGSIVGRVDLEGTNGKLAGFEGARVVLSPGGRVTYTYTAGNYRFDNLAPGEYSVQLDPTVLPPGVQITPAPDYRLVLPSGGSINQVNFRLRVEAPARPVERIVQPNEQVDPPGGPVQTPSPPRSPKRNNHQKR